MTDIFLVGIAGRMGKNIVETASGQNDVRISGGLDSVPCESAPTFKNAADVNVNVDVIVDFSRPQALDSVIELADRFDCPVVLASTGYDEEQLAKIKQLEKRHAVLTSGNMSFGVTLLSSLVKTAAAALGEDFDVEIVEKHHNNKVDAPSGTALMLADAAASVRETSPKYECARNGKNCKRERGDIGISSVRGGTIVGEHDVMFIGNDEIITLSHTALSRKIFAVGAIRAARFLIGKKPGHYDMNDVLGLKK